MKYYIYVSDAKLDMLYAQIPRRVVDRLATELTVDLQLLSISLKEKPSDENRYAKLKLVAGYIDKHLKVGTVDEPEAYFRGNLPMRWGPLGGYFGVKNPNLDDPLCWYGSDVCFEWDPAVQSAVYFGGFTAETVLGLGGSLHHVIGHYGDKPRVCTSSAPVLLALLGREPRDGVDPHLQDIGKPGGFPIPRFEIMSVVHTTAVMRGPQQRVEFLAKRLLERRIRDFPTPLQDIWPDKNQAHVLLGTPIYVALAD